MKFLIKYKLIIIISILGILSLSVFFWIKNDSLQRLKTEFNLCFLKDTPGATDRYITFTPYLCNDPQKNPIGEAIGEDWAELSLLDVDSDGTPEIIIQPSTESQFSGVCVSPRKSVWKIQKNDAGKVSLKLIESISLPNTCESDLGENMHVRPQKTQLGS